MSGAGDELQQEVNRQRSGWLAQVAAYGGDGGDGGVDRPQSLEEAMKIIEDLELQIAGLEGDMRERD